MKPRTIIMEAYARYEDEGAGVQIFNGHDEAIEVRIAPANESHKQSLRIRAAKTIIYSMLLLFLAAPAHAESTYDWSGSSHARLAPHFTAKEFRCHDCGIAHVDGELLYRLELLRKELGGLPIHISSGYRCEAHNKEVGGVKKSQHTRGNAADVQVRGVSPSRVAAAAKRVGFTFIKQYPTWTHVDVRR